MAREDKERGDEGWGYGTGEDTIESEETLSPDERDDDDDADEVSEDA
jgi:hypothetical protein